MSAYRSCSTAKKYINAPKLWGFRKWNAINLGLVPRPLFGCLLKSQNYYFLYLFPIHMYIVCVCVWVSWVLFGWAVPKTRSALLCLVIFQFFLRFFFCPGWGWCGLVLGWFFRRLETGGWDIYLPPVVAFCLPCYYKLSAVRSARARRVSTKGGWEMGSGKWEMGKGGMGFSFPQSLHHRPISPSMGFSVIDFALQWMRLLRARLNDLSSLMAFDFCFRSCVPVPSTSRFAQERIINTRNQKNLFYAFSIC